MKETANIEVIGIVKITDKDSNELLLNEENHIHTGNLGFIFASALTNAGEYFIESMAFGNGASEVNATGQIIYKSPRVEVTKNLAASLYNQTYSKTDITKLLVEYGTGYYDITVTCILDYNEPSGQNTLDYVDAPDYNTNDFIFDEIALYSKTGYMLTHKIFHPVLKSQNRAYEIEYTIRIRVV